MSIIYIYGAGLTGAGVCGFAEREKEDIVFIDNDIDKQQKDYLGHKVISFEDFGIVTRNTKEKQKVIIALNDKNRKEVLNKIENFSSSNKIKYILAEDYISQKGQCEKKLLACDDFTIISNNCWGGWVYRYFGLPYLTPTIGLFFFSDDYIKFISNLEYYFNQRLEFINSSKAKKRYYKETQNYLWDKYPIGRLNDIDIHFLHYESEQEAFEKWNRRKKRINWDKLIIKYSTQNLWSISDINSFWSLPFKNKLFFSSIDFNGKKEEYFFKIFAALKNTGNEGLTYSLYIDMLDYINHNL